MKIFKNIANIITGTRIISAIMMLCMPAFTLSFWGCYIGAGVTDIIDGFVARKLNQQSEFGAKLDSIADFIFAICLFIVAIRSIRLTRWVWIVAGIIALLRFLSYGIGYVKYHTFASLHTYLNKMTGLSIFLFPLFYLFFGTVITELVISVIAFLSAVEELLITIRSDKLVRNRKSIFIKIRE